MAIPNTNTFTLNDVCNELGLPSSHRFLSYCFMFANSTKFDPAYSGNKDSLSNFRNYNAGSTENTIISSTTYINVPPAYQTINITNTAHATNDLQVSFDATYYNFINLVELAPGDYEVQINANTYHSPSDPTEKNITFSNGIDTFVLIANWAE